MSEATNLESSPRNTVRIVRDSTFHRFVADEALAALHGRDLEVGFVQYGPLFTSRTDFGDYEETKNEPAMTEVARMRMSYAAFMSFAMDTLREGILEGRVKGDAVRKSIDEWIEQATTSGEDRVS
jgi:hypothetical protein